MGDARLIWKGEDISQYGKLGDAVCALTEDDAAEFWETYVDYHYAAIIMKRGLEMASAREEAERIARSNIGYLMGYYGEEDRKRVYELFPAVSHPVFGRMEADGGTAPTAEEALLAGMQAGARQVAEGADRAD